MPEKNEYIGLSFNECRFCGRVVGEPTYFPIEGGEGAFINLKTRFRKMEQNGQFVDAIQVVPLVVMDTRKTENTVKKYIMEGRQIKVDAFFSTWGDQGENHGFMVTNILLGDKPFVPKADQNNAGPALPQ